MATSMSRIDKENRKRTKRIISVIINLIVMVFLHVYTINFIYLWRITRRPEVSTIAVQTFKQIVSGIDAFFGIEPNDYFIIAMVTAFIGCIMVIIYNTRKMRQHDDPETVNGTAKLMDQKDLDEFNKRRSDPIGSKRNDGPNNMILSRDIFLSMDGWKTRRNCNILVIGGSGAGKSRFFAAPNILQFNANFIITDPSGELLEDYGKVLENNGYTVRVFNLVDVYKGNRYNPFHYIKEEKDVFILVNTLIKNTTPSEGKAGDPFWEKCEKLLLQALILYLWHNVPEEEQTFANIIKLIDMADVDENDASAESKLDRLFNALTNEDPDNLAAQEYRNFKKAAGKTLKSIIISVVARMESFMLSDIQYLTSKDEFEFEKFADSKQALFVIIPTADTTFNFLVSLMYAQMFLTLYEYVETRAKFGWQAIFNNREILKVIQAKDKDESKTAKASIEDFIKEVKAGLEIEYDDTREVYSIYTKNTHELVTWRGSEKVAKEVAEQIRSTISIKQCIRTCPNHVRLILDEFANIGTIPDFNEKLATLRKYNLSCSIILQALSQLKKMYKDDWNTIAANCDTKLFLGSDDQETIEWLVKMLGKRTTTVENLSMQNNSMGSESYNKSSIELMTVDQVAQMDDDECIVRIRGVNPYHGLKYDLLNHPKYGEAQETKGQFIIPESKAAKNKNSHIPLRLRKHAEAAEAAKAAESEAAPAKEPEAPPVRRESEAKTSASEKHPAGTKPEVKAENPKVNITHRVSEEHVEQPAETQKEPDYGITEKPSTASATSKRRKAENKVRKEDSIKNQEKVKNYQEEQLNADEMMAVAAVLDAARIPVGASDTAIKERVASLLKLPKAPDVEPSYKMTD